MKDLTVKELWDIIHGLTANCIERNYHERKATGDPIALDWQVKKTYMPLMNKIHQIIKEKENQK